MRGRLKHADQKVCARFWHPHTQRKWKFFDAFFSPFLISGLLFGSLVSAAAEDKDPLSKLPPPDSIKLSTVIEQVEGRPGFYAIESITFADGEYRIVYFMGDGAEVRINYDAKTGASRPPRRGLFGN